MRSGSPGCGRTSPAPTSPHHPANDAQQEAFEEALALATDAGLEPEVRHLANSAGALLRPSARYDLVRVGHRRLRVQPGPRRGRDRAARAGPGDDGARVRRTHQGAGGRRRRLLRAHLRGRGADAGGAGADGVRRRHPAPRLQRRRGARRTGCADACSAGSAWTSSSSRHPARTPATRSCCSAPGLTASRRRPTGPGGAGPSTTRSSPGWVAGRPGCGSGKRTRRVSTRRSLAYAAGGLGAAALAAVATGVVVERRVVKARKAGAAQADRLGVLRSDPIEVTCDDGVVLHAEVDEVAPYADSRTARRRRATRRRDAGVRARLRAQPRLLALPARGVPRQAPDGVLRPALARSLRARSTATTRPSTSSATTSRG